MIGLHDPKVLRLLVQNCSEKIHTEVYKTNKHRKNYFKSYWFQLANNENKQTYAIN